MTRIIIIAVLIMFGSCHTNDNIEGLSKKASPIVNRFYHFIQHNNFDSTRFLFTDNCLALAPPDTLISMLERMNHQRGNVDSFLLEENKYSVSHKNGKRTNEFTQVYKVVYASGFVTKEEFGFLEEDLNTTNPAIINSYVIDFYYPPDN